MSTTDTDVSAGALQELTRDQDLWFEDGSVVMIAQTTAFRVHKSVLSRHSCTFSELFSIPQPADPESVDLIDGCPMVRVTDSAHDFQHILHILYDIAKSVFGFLFLNITNLQPVLRDQLSEARQTSGILRARRLGQARSQIPAGQHRLWCLRPIRNRLLPRFQELRHVWSWASDATSGYQPGSDGRTRSPEPLPVSTYLAEWT